MSILLSAYFPEGIVFAADKNTTLFYETSLGTYQDTEVGAATKVITWPDRKAVVGYCGLGELRGLRMEEWFRQFVAHTRDFDDLGSVALQMRQMIQQDFDQDYPPNAPVEDARLIIHIGGFSVENGIHVPVMYYMSNVPGMDRHAKYAKAIREFSEPSDHLRRDATKLIFRTLPTE